MQVLLATNNKKEVAMAMYLFKVSLKTKGVPLCYKTAKQKPIYLVASTKEAAERLANEKIKDHVEIRAISKMAEQLAPHIFSGA
jgi:hypothetical protein